MTGQYLAASLMFLITVGVTAIFWLPAIKVVQKCEIVKFYWTGFWAFLGGLVALSGAQSVLIILGQDVQKFSNAILLGVTAAFIVFVMFAWARLALRGAAVLTRKAVRK